MIIGFSVAKNLGYSKVHHIEYDCKITEVSEFIENSWLLNEHNSVVYMDKKEGIAEIMFGSFQSYFIPKLNPLLTKLNEEEIAQIKEMQTQYNKFVFELGSVEAQLADMAAHRITMETEKSNVINDLKTLSTKERELLSTLQEKYGVGNINIETGEITPF